MYAAFSRQTVLFNARSSFFWLCSRRRSLAHSSSVRDLVVIPVTEEIEVEHIVLSTVIAHVMFVFLQRCFACLAFSLLPQLLLWLLL